MLKRLLALTSLLVLLAACTQPGPSTVTVSVSPPIGATDVEVDTVVTAQFSQAMNPDTIDAAAFTLASPDGAVAGDVTYDAATRTATFTPEADLEFDTEYTATVAATVRSEEGGRLRNSGAFAWSFTTVADGASVTAVVVTPDEFALLVGDDEQLSAEVTAMGGADETVTWESSDVTVATVDEDGLVTGVAAGTATITATSTFDTTISGTAEVTVTDTPAVTAVTVTPESAELEAGETQQFTAEVTATEGADETVTWESSDEGVATVDADGLVTAVAAGTATITATSTFDTTISGTAEVTVSGGPAVTGVTVTPETAEVTVGGTVTLTVDVAAEEGADETVTWSSDDEAVATVDADGIVTGVAPGTATITATSNADGNLSDSATVTVIGGTTPLEMNRWQTPTIDPGEPLDLDLGVSGGLAPYQYDLTVSVPDGFPENYDDVDYDDISEIGPLDLPPNGITVDEVAGALVGSSTEEGYYAFFIEVTDALNQVDYIFVELAIGDPDGAEEGAAD